MTAEHVVVLGAGFSRAISAGMPLTDELGQLAVRPLAERLHERSTRLEFGPELSFESWLSLLSEDQPQLNEAQNRDNAALFAHLRDTIGDLLLDAQRRTLEQSAPAWLYKLVSVLHRQRATVITLNYDVLIEAAVQSRVIWDEGVGRRVQSGDLLGNLPALPNIGARLVGPICRTFALLKLHGSLDWWAVPNDISGATLNREDTHPAFEAPDEMPTNQRQRELPGRERFIIPPLSTKGGYYRNPLTRELWQQAHRALGTASRISIVGYSLPAADLVMASMLRTALTNPNLTVDVVNPQPDALVRRLIGLGLQEDSIDVTTGGECVRAFTRSLSEQTSAAVADQLKQSLLGEFPGAALAVAWGSPTAIDGSARQVIDVSTTGGTLELVLEEDPHSGDVTAARVAADGALSREQLPLSADLAAKLGDCHRVVAKVGGNTHTVIAAWHEGRQTGANHDWIFFSPVDHGTR